MFTLQGKYTDDCKVFIDGVEDSAIELIKNILDNPAFAGAKVRIMPDTHTGKGIVIGFTAPLTEYVNPDHVGVDIGCTIDSWFTDVDAKAVNLERFERDIRKLVMFGQEIQETAQTSPRELCRFIQAKMDAWRSAWPEMIQEVKVDEKFITAFCRRVRQDEKVFWKSIGTVGGGNHFIEVGAHPETGKLVFTIHCGSRNLGVKIASYHARIGRDEGDTLQYKRELNALIERMKAEGRHKEINDEVERFRKKFVPDCPDGYLKGDRMSDYLTDMAIGLAYALHNHDVISGLIVKALQRQCPRAKVKDMVRSVHNYVDFTDHVIRKGAVRSYEGERLVIPFNMRDGLAICTGKSNADWNCSAPHGAGRVMSRAAAMRELSVDEFKEQMAGIVSTSVGAGTIDEAPGAYKSTELVMSLITDTCTVDYLVRPLINLKDQNTVALPA